ncbi:MAG: DUF2628 domain-containing protein [Fulvimarina manganoxydans]|uniref:DUF2628 domain-containing protein n=1 Tax=Fulvimarina manganoxydans TaxID=937218 RepID=UPI002351FBBB|nr:DUF2628 domain-containing protein [Fulvimarina manganoxydans]MCK5931158.1 DUF2628 domain-containing protein [Fulvimarina manganoxydans]
MRLARWIVMDPPGHGPSDSGGPKPSENARFIKDRFSPFAFFFTFLWLFWHRLWIAGLIVLGLDIGLYVLMAGSDLELLSSAIQIGLALLIGLEGRNLVCERLRRKGWRESAVIYAGKLSEAETIYFHGQIPALEGAGNRRALKRTPPPVSPPVTMPWTAPTPPATPPSA